MSALLDTHVFLWWNESGGARVSATARELIADPSNEILLSAASVWEMAIKVSRGRLELPQPMDRYVPDRMARNALSPLPVDVAHAVRVALLPVIHADPFDRLLIAQAQVEGIPILTSDPALSQYDVETIW